MDPTIAQAFALATLRETHENGLRIGRQSDEMMLRVGRQSDASALDHRQYAGFVATQLFNSDDPMTVAGMNTAIRTPSTVEHPLYYPTPLQGSPIK